MQAVARAIIDSYNAMDCILMNVGPFDLAAGPAFIDEIAKRADFPLLSSNIRKEGDEELLFKTHLVKKMNGLKVGFIGVATGNSKLQGFEFDDPVASVKPIAAELRPKVDLIVILANVDDKTELALARDVPEIDFLVRSGTGSLYRIPKVKNGAIVIRNSRQGKYAGVLTIKLTDPEVPLTNISQQMSRIGFADKRLTTMSRDLKEGETLEEKFKDNQSRLNVVSRLRKEREVNVKQISEFTNTYFFRAMQLNDKIDDEPEVAEIVAEYMPKEKGKDPHKH